MWTLLVSVAWVLSFGCGRIDFDRVPPSGQEDTQPWQVPEARQRYRVRVVAELVDEPTRDLVVGAQLASATELATATGEDLDVFLSDGTPLSFELDDTALWVRVPYLDPSYDTYFFIYRGQAIGQPSGIEVFGSGYDLVVHEASRGPEVTDSTREAPSVIRGTIARGIGRLGHGVAFSGGTTIVEFPDTRDILDGWDEFTVSFWLYLDYEDLTSLDIEPMIFEKKGPLELGRILPRFGEDDMSFFQVDAVFQSGTEYRQIPVAGRTWEHLLLTFDSSSYRGYRNGQREFRVEVGSGLIAGEEPLRLGGGDALIGVIDEFRIAPAGFSEPRVAAEWRALSNLPRFVELGQVEER